MTVNISETHKEVIIGTFVIGTLAFIVAQAWGGFVTTILKEIETKENADRGLGLLFYSGMYMVIITIVAVAIIFLLINFDLVRHSHGR